MGTAAFSLNLAVDGTRPESDLKWRHCRRLLPQRGAFGDQVGHQVLVVRTFGPRWRRHAGLVGLELVGDLLDGAVGGAALLGGGPIRPSWW